MLALNPGEVSWAGTSLGFPPLTRMIAHAETAVDDWSSANEWVEYEMRLNDVLPRYDDPVIRTYAAARLKRGQPALDIFAGTHPRARDHRRRAGGRNRFFQPGGLSARDLVNGTSSPPQAYRG